jgi:hypothetical protein
VIQDEIPPYMRMMLSPAKRNLLVAMSVIAFGLISLISGSFAQTESAAGIKPSDATAVSAMQSRGAEGDSIGPGLSR